MLVVLAGDFGVRYLFEREDLGIEIHRPIHVGDGDSDCVYAVDQSGGLLGQACGTARIARSARIMRSIARRIAEHTLVKAIWSTE